LSPLTNFRGEDGVTQDLVQTLDDLHSWKVSVLAQTGLSFDLSSASGKLMRTIMAGLAEFERDLIRDWSSQVWQPRAGMSIPLRRVLAIRA
jgi:DNA invertase Pin-like site-specific DNA recombinase